MISFSSLVAANAKQAVVTTQLSRHDFLQQTAKAQGIDPNQSDAALEAVIAQRSSASAAQLQAQVAARDTNILGQLGQAVSGPLKSALANTPLAPFAGVVGSALQGDIKGVVSNTIGAVVAATPLGEVPGLGQFATQAATSLADRALGISSGVSKAAAAAPTVAGDPPPPPPKTVSPGVNNTSAVDVFGSPLKLPLRDPASATPQGSNIVKPYGKVFSTRSAWEAFAARPETAGGTIGFPPGS